MGGDVDVAENDLFGAVRGKPAQRCHERILVTSPGRTRRHRREAERAQLHRDEIGRHRMRPRAFAAVVEHRERVTHVETGRAGAQQRQPAVLAAAPRDRRRHVGLPANEASTLPAVCQAWQPR